ncbi:YhgE/Pip family protein, partial [Kitasatospora sp. NPDC047058]|uniref:YhgE/Pip domain-containing protein n=1 Tax=Kitasatospora sp. NPDC047058 TaxID=3155620 RepID=UPI0033F83D52
YLELRRFRGPLRRAVPVLLCLIPLLYGAMYLWANWDPYGKTDRIRVAVVNLDHPATSAQGTTVDAGAEVVGRLKASGTFGWQFVDRKAASAGLRTGRYAFTIEIPADFSSRLTSASDPQPRQAGIRMELNDANNYIAGVMTEVVQSKLEAQIDSATHEAYVRALYGELSQVRRQLAAASNGARQLVTATATAQQATAALTAVNTTAHTGTTQLATGAQQISQAITRVDDAARSLETSASRQIPAAASALVTAATVAADGTDSVRTGTSQVKQGTATAVADLRALASAHPELDQDPAFQRVLRDSQQVDGAAGQVDARASSAHAAATQALTVAQDLQRKTGTLQQQALAVTTPLQLVDTGAQGVAAG